jgi:rubredoxin
MKNYKCICCGYVYEPEIGDPEHGVSPGTTFNDLPGDWNCPTCGADKDNFEPVD